MTYPNTLEHSDAIVASPVVGVGHYTRVEIRGRKVQSANYAKATWLQVFESGVVRYRALRSDRGWMVAP
jgi:hypothetical protein